ncbi:MAG: hypothetical protein K1X78_05550 [Verrucomicrobiaceae bacterium]|nr:hypothetical protein [Verrucomicrobiaceae bacterium]
MSEIIWPAGAEADLLEHYSRYEDISPGLGDGFYQRVNEAVDLLRSFPEIAPSHVKPFLRLLLKSFPIGVFHMLEGRRIAVHALLDLRQSPKTIMRRLSGRLS